MYFGELILEVMMDYILIRDGNGDLCVMPADVFDLACKDGTLPFDTRPIFKGGREDCLAEMYELGGEHGGN